MARKIDLLGMVFNRWTVIKEADKEKESDKLKWVCKCECGNVSKVPSTYLTKGKSKSCGCYKGEVTAMRNKTHGMSHIDEYGIWQTMINRCYNENVKGYHNYGGRGVFVCDRWLESFENFFEDVGLRPTKKHSLDRFPDINGNYEPSNFRWATKEQQQRGQRRNVWLEHNGEKMVLIDWAKRFGVRHTCISEHLKSGKTFSEIVEHYKNKKAA